MPALTGSEAVRQAGGSHDAATGGPGSAADKASAMGRSGRSLSIHLGALCAILLLPMLLLGGLLLLRLAWDERSRHQAVVRDAAQHIATSVDLALTTSRAMLEVLATSDLLRRGDLTAFSERVADVTRVNGAQIALYDMQGRWLGGTANGAEQAPARCLPGATGRLAVDREQPQISGYRRDGPAGPAAFAMVVSVAGAGGVPRYLLSLCTPIQRLRLLLQRESLAPGMVASLIDQDGLMLAGTGTPAGQAGQPLAPSLRSVLAAGEEGWLRVAGRGHDAAVLAFARTEVAGWTAIVSLPDAAFAAPLRRSIRIALAMGGVLVLLAAGLAYVFSRRIARPIAELARFAADGSGQAGQWPGAVREVNEVADALAHARAESLRRQREGEALILTLDRAQVLVRDMDGRIRTWTSGTERLLGWPRGEAIGRTTQDLLATVFPDPPEAIERHLLATGEWRGELRYLRQDGVAVVVASHWALLRDPAGEPQAVVEAFNDITDLHAVETELRRSRDLLASVVNGSADPIFAKDADGRFVILNPPAAALLGVPMHRALGHRVAELVGPDIAARIDAADTEVMASGRVHVTEDEITLPDGTQRILVSTKAPWRDASGCILGVVGVTRDISERRRAQNRLRQTQAELFHVGRVNAMGVMAAALAHELNQPLTAIMNYGEACVRMLGDDRPIGEVPLADLREAMDGAVAEALRAGLIVRRLREFVGRGESEKRLLDLNGVVEESAALALSGSLSEGIDLRLDLAPDLGKVLADHVQIQQVLVNLVRNAADAMADHERPELCVSTAMACATQVEVLVSDRGPGIAAEVADRLFEPFVSTKRDGMGMGLSICRSIIEEHGGRLETAARPGGGTMFRFVLPVHGEGG